MMVVFAASSDEDECVAAARAWMRAQGLTSDDVRLVKRGGQVLVIDRCETWKRLRPMMGIV